jgi:hypothetical protein
MTMKPPFFVAGIACFAAPTDPSIWIKSKARTVEGAKRLAVKRAQGVTFTALVGVENTNGEIQVIASLNDSSAITRRRATWRGHTAI